MPRRTKIIIGVIVLLIVAGVILWYFFFRAAPSGAPTGGEFPSAGEQEFPPEATKPTELPAEAFRPILRRLSTEPVAGAVAGAKSGGGTAVRYIDRATGNAYEISAEGGSATRLTNTTIPKVYEALWSRGGVSLLARRLKEDGETIETFSGKIKPAEGGEGDLTGVFLPQNISSAAFSPDGRELAYLREEEGGAVGIKAAPDGSGRTEVFRSPLREWNIIWSAPQTIAFLTKPSALASGMLVAVPPSGEGELSPVIRGVFGLTALPNHEFGQVLYSASTESGFSLNLLDIRANASARLPLTTLPEKCAWAKNDRTLFCGVPALVPGGSYPDAWYQGLVSFTDEVWRFDAGGAATELVLDISGEGSGPIDLVSPLLSPDEKFLIFLNKNDSILWGLQLKE